MVDGRVPPLRSTYNFSSSCLPVPYGGAVAMQYLHRQRFFSFFLPPFVFLLLLKTPALSIFPTYATYLYLLYGVAHVTYPFSLHLLGLCKESFFFFKKKGKIFNGSLFSVWGWFKWGHVHLVVFVLLSCLFCLILKFYHLNRLALKILTFCPDLKLHVPPTVREMSKNIWENYDVWPYYWVLI